MLIFRDDKVIKLTDAEVRAAAEELKYQECAAEVISGLNKREMSLDEKALFATIGNYYKLRESLIKLGEDDKTYCVGKSIADVTGK